MQDDGHMANGRQDPVLRLQNGDRNAFRELVEEYQAQVRLAIASHGLQSQDVDDIAQDVFIFVYEHIHEFKAGTNFRAWCKAIARNKVFAFFEVKKRERRNNENALEFFLLEQSERLADEDAPDRIMEKLQTCMAQLTERTASLVKARYTGTPLEHLAGEINRSVAAVKMTLLRARLELKKCMESQA